ncbi:hypothetical protein K493DRAFT_309478 [Basidiobolus meristosporus CBS 931.73]|uniref:Uncharacterized protein n=1 Tax=Basidiobolus meristosporus CBS 931.73 TaxID=1314790 RepID=A0A1Y1VVI5_9FUNG|nr:hypothetical protein K493DRAFT_309478 [Basidiobolus meristosporus CBS 931.73]|eukprot:ORX65006.1 hypothetical protein K493DRAFT_309478 [Basidiobolus meristosporus CBS 931.73]
MMFLKSSVFSSFLMVTLAYGDRSIFFKPATSNNAAIASVSNHEFNPFHNTGHGILIPNYLINREVELAPEEIRRRHLNIGALIDRLLSLKTLGFANEFEFKGARFIDLEPAHEFFTKNTDMKYGTTSDEAVNDNSDMTSDNVDEDDEDTNPEEAELWGRFGGRRRWGRGRWGRGRWGRGRWGRGRWGRW